MRIGLFSDTYIPDINGVVSSIITLQKELENHGHEVYVITNHKAFMGIQKEGNILRLPGLELKWLYGYKLSTPYHFNAKNEIEKMDLDVIHVHTEFGVGLFGRIVGKYLNIPVVSTYHTMYEDYTHYINRFDINEIEVIGKKFVTATSRMLSDNVQAVIAPSEKTKETLLKYGVHTPITIIPTGLNLSKFNHENIDFEKVEQLKQEYNIQTGDKVITFVGRIAKEKSIEIPIEGFRYLTQPNIKLLIVGGGPQLEELQELVKQYHLEDNVIFTGPKVSDEIPLYYAMADAFVSASLTETQGMTYIEALASNLIVFARPDDVLVDLIQENKNGFFFHDAKEFIQKVEAYFNLDSNMQRQMQKAASLSIACYDSEIFYQNVIQVYEQAIRDYEHAYEVIKIKAGSDYMRIYVENDKEQVPLKINISLEDYFLLKIQKNMLLDRYLIEELQEKEVLLQAYRSCIKKLKLKDYTEKEMVQYLRKHHHLEDVHIQKIMDELRQRGYVNDHQYMLDKIEKMQFSLQGKGKIIKSLIEKGISHDEVEKALSLIDDDQEIDKAIKVAHKLAYTMKDKSLQMKRKLIAQKLMLQGFDHTIAKHVSDELELQHHDNKAALEKTIAKAIRLYQRKFSQNDLKHKVAQYCIQKGFEKAETWDMLNEMEWEDEEMDQ